MAIKKNKIKASASSQSPVITVVGNDKKGIVAQISAYLCEKKINIEEIQQGITTGKFFMVMSIDITESDFSIFEISEQLQVLAKKIGVQINIYDQKIFTVMNKI